MIVESYLRAQIPGYPFDNAVLENAALSPIFARPIAMKAIQLSDVIEDNANNEEFIKSLKYATSTLFYSASGVFSGGSRSERVGEIQSSISGFIVTKSDREYYRSVANKLREELGAEIEQSAEEAGGLFDATPMQYGK